MPKPQLMMCSAIEVDGKRLPSWVPSEMRWCVICGCDVWVSTPMVAAVDRLEVTPHCEMCLLGLIANNDDTDIEIHPDQAAQLKQLGVEPAVRALRRMLKKPK